MLRIYLKIFLGLLLLLLFSHCSDSIIESTPSIDEGNEEIVIAPTFTEIQTNILNPSCAFSGCHVSGSVNPDLSGNSFTNIVNKQSSTGIDYIEPNNPANSYLLQKILGSNTISGSRMPLNNSALSQEKINALTEWINNGAKND